MKQTLQILNGMVSDGIIDGYAIAGAIAAFQYIEATATEDLDILANIHVVGSGLVTMAPLFSYLREKGYAEFRKEGIVIEGWPVQFLPIADDLDKEAMEAAEDTFYVIRADDPEPVSMRIIQAVHVVAFAVRTGRPKDWMRVDQFLNESKVDLVTLKDVLTRHGLLSKWQAFVLRFRESDPLP